MHTFTYLYTLIYGHLCTAGLFALRDTAILLYTAFCTSLDRSTALLLFALNTALMLFALLDTALMLYTARCNTRHSSTALHCSTQLYCSSYTTLHTTLHSSKLCPTRLYTLHLCTIITASHGPVGSQLQEVQ